MHPRAASFPTGEPAQGTKTCGMLGIRAQPAEGAAVNRTGGWSSGEKELAPRRRLELRFTAPKAAVLPLDDRGVLRLLFHFSLVP